MTDTPRTPYQILGEDGIHRLADAVRNREGPSIAAGNPDIIAAG